MGLLDLYAAQADRSAPNPLQTVPRTLGERVEATAAETFAPDRYFRLEGTRRDMWQRSTDELYQATGERFANPLDPPTPDELFKDGVAVPIPEIRQNRQNQIINAARMARAAGNDALFDPENIDRYIAEEATRRRERAGSYVDTGNGVGNFLASTILETATPHGVVGLAIPVTRLPSAAASSIGRTFLANVGREAAFQATANAGLQAIAEGLDAASRSEVGTAPSLGESLTNIAGAGAFGALIGGGVRALHLKWLGLPESVRAQAPLEVRDAFRVIEADALYSGQNRLGIDPMLHERYQGNAMDAVMRGRPVDLADLTRGGDTALTAVGRALQAPETIRAQGLDGLTTALDRVRALPDSELEPIVRELKPASFQKVDEVDAKIRALDDRVAAIQRETEQIGVSDVADIDTAARLQDIEQRLTAKGLRRAVRQDLERERDMILESVGPALGADLRAARRDLFPEHAATLRQIEEERAGLMRERALAAGDAKREVDFLRSKLDKLEIRQDMQPALAEMGFPQAPDIGPMLARAEMMRQARVVRDVVPDGVRPDFRAAGEAPPSARASEQAVSPEVQKALDLEAARVIKGRPDLEMEIDGRTMSAREAFEDADRMAKDAQAALNCAIGAL
jgi:hypothetical protein